MYESIDSINNMIGALSSEQKVLSNNIANVHTPGYTAKKYSFTDVLGNLSNPYETPLSQKMGSINGSIETTDTGKSVDLANEMLEMQKVSLNYSMVTRRATSIFNNIRRATQIGR